jgi:uncharacterized membrane protein YeiH
MNFDHLIFSLEMVGTVAFAVSGVMVAKERKMDIFGAILLGCVTAVGGGMIRDLILGETPPAMFRRPIYVDVSFVTCLISFVLERHRLGRRFFDRFDQTHARTALILNAADSIGLAAFVVVGCRTAVNAGYGDNTFLTSFVGVLTGIGGGILRDIMAGQMPLIMRKRVYGIAAIAGALLYTELQTVGVQQLIAAVISMLCTVLIRFLAIYFRWNLPAFR